MFALELSAQIVINLFCMMLMLVILFNELGRPMRFVLSEKLFLGMVFSNLLVSTADAVAWSMEGRVGSWYVPANHLCTSASYLAIPFLSMFWFLYANHQIYNQEPMLKKLAIPASIPAIATVVLLIINPFVPLLYTLDSTNHFHRGPLSLPLWGLSYIMMAVTCVMLLINRSRMDSHRFIPMIFYIVPVLLTTLATLSFYGLAIAWTGSSLSIVTIYIFIQNQRMGTDYLTGLLNRRTLDDMLSSRMKGRRTDDVFGILMLDVDHFKSINDTWGHRAGDEVLVTLSGLLNAAIRNSDIIARYAGDEFVIVLDTKNPDEIQHAIARLNDVIRHYNNTSGKPWTLDVSIGYELYQPSSCMTPDQLLHHIDKRMYHNKQSKLAAQKASQPATQG